MNWIINYYLKIYLKQEKLLGLSSYNVLESWPSRPQQLSVPGDQIAAVIEELDPASAYHLRVTAQNALGLGNPSEVIQATTEEEGLSFT